MTRDKPIKPKKEGRLSLNIITPIKRVNKISPACVDSTIDSFRGLTFTNSVALKNRVVAIIPEKTATINDWAIWLELGGPI